MIKCTEICANVNCYRKIIAPRTGIFRVNSTVRESVRLAAVYRVCRPIFVPSACSLCEILTHPRACGHKPV